MSASDTPFDLHSAIVHLTEAVTWQALVDVIRETLDAAMVFNASAVSRWVVEEASGLEGADWLIGRSDTATVGGIRRVESMVRRLIGGEPVQYVLGHWAFRQLDLMVDPRVLIPRPETEVLVDVVLRELRAMDAESDSPAGERRRRVADLGTGSGAIGLAIVTEAVDVEVVLTDVDPASLAVARANLVAVGRPAGRVAVAEGSWFDALNAVGADHESFDVIVSNPPYVAEGDEVDPAVVAWEPHRALFAADAGRAELAVIADGVARWLRPGGILAVELDPRQASWMIDRVSTWARDAWVESDLSGRGRFVLARR